MGRVVSLIWPCDEMNRPIKQPDYYTLRRPSLLCGAAVVAIVIMIFVNYGGGGYYGWGAGYNATTFYSTDYNQGTLIIDIFRLKDKRLIWQGMASGEVKTDLEKRDKRLPMTISQVYRKYPARVKNKKDLDNQGE